MDNSVKLLITYIFDLDKVTEDKTWPDSVGTILSLMSGDNRYHSPDRYHSKLFRFQVIILKLCNHRIYQSLREKIKNLLERLVSYILLIL
jgi:hypothetical protein